MIKRDDYLQFTNLQDENNLKKWPARMAWVRRTVCIINSINLGKIMSRSKMFFLSNEVIYKISYFISDKNKLECFGPLPS